MSIQYSLFGGEPPHIAGSATSHGAAVAIESAASTLRSKVFALLKQGPKTDEEMQSALEMNPSTQRPRRVELVKMGLVVDTGATKLTRSGRRAVLWRVR